MTQLVAGATPKDSNRIQAMDYKEEIWDLAMVFLRALTERQVIGTMFGFLSNDAQGCFYRASPVCGLLLRVRAHRTQQQVIGTMFGFLSIDSMHYALNADLL